LPEGYLETLLYDRNIIGDRRLGAFYDRLSLITRGDLFSGERMRAIWEMHSGQYQSLINYEAYRHPSAEDIRRSRQRLEPRAHLRPNAFTRHVALGNIYFISRHFDRAAVDYGKALEQPGRQSASEEELRHVYLRLALSFYASGQEEEAVRSLEAFVPENMRTADIKTILENALQQALNGVDL
jgi:tetratricopeptide (TPR) repeat protein